MSNKTEKYFDENEEVWFDSYQAWLDNINRQGYVAPHGEQYDSYDQYQCIHFPKDFIDRKVRVYRNYYAKVDCKEFLTNPMSPGYERIVDLFGFYINHEYYTHHTRKDPLLSALNDIDKMDIVNIENLEKLGFHDWYNNILYKPLPSAQTSRPPAERTTFLKALEDAFWEANGPQLLVKLAESNPLEFLKICAKLIDPSAKAPNAGLSISFNVTAEKGQEKEVNPLNPD